MTHDHALTRLRSWPEREAEAYRRGEDRPLGGYLKLMSLYATGTVSAYLGARRLGRPIPRLSPWDVAHAPRVSCTRRSPGKGSGTPSVS